MFDSYADLPPVKRQGIILTNALLLLIEPLLTDFGEIWVLKIQQYFFQ